MKKPLKNPKVLWGLCVSAYTVWMVMLGETTGYLPHHSIPSGLILSHMALSCLSPAFRMKLKKRGVFPPHSSCCWQTLSSPGKLLVLAWKTQSRRPLPRVIFSTSLVWQPLTQGPYPCCTIFRNLWAEAVLGSQSKAVPCFSSTDLASSRKISINYRNRPNPSLQCLPSITSCFWNY